MIIKLFILYFITYFYYNKFYILFNVSNIDTYFNNDYQYFLKYNLKLNGSVDFKNKSILFNIIKNLTNTSIKNIAKVDKIFLCTQCRFGNCLVYLNNYISICEIIGCKTILLDKDTFWFIKNNIRLKNNIELKLGNRKELKKNFLNFRYYQDNYYYFPIGVNIILLRDEIIKHLPKIKISKNDLYIHIRSEDIFKLKNVHNEHVEPPLCFYNKILNFFKFEKIFIISYDNLNPIINKLIKYYPNIIFKNNKLTLDISYLINAYNIVSSVTSFILGLLQLNYNIKFLWDYNSYHWKVKNRLFHYDLYKYPNRSFTIYRMEPSNTYKKVIYYFKNLKKQIKLMLKDKCDNQFEIILYNKYKYFN